MHLLRAILVILTLAAPTSAAPLPKRAQPPGSRIALLPGNLVLTGPLWSQQVVVEKIQGGRSVGDLTSRSTFTSSRKRVATVDAEGIVRGVRDGTARIQARVGRQVVFVGVTVRGRRQAASWSFENHVLPVFTKTGCNSGACHGASAGKGGLKLTLRGFDPQTDHSVITRQALGRRVALSEPARSLILSKPVMAVPHGGGMRFGKASLEYRVLRDWIASGAPRPDGSAPRLLGLEVLPRAATLRPGAKQQLLVRARFGDGRVEDVTRWAKWGTNDSAVAAVDDYGQVTVQGRGEAAITIWYLSRVAFATISAPYAHREPEVFARVPRHNFIDGLVLNKLRSLGIPPSGPTSDAEFLRRAYLDAAGILPTPEELKTFVADAAPPKREKAIAALLERPEFVDYWAYRWSDLLLVSSRKLPAPAMQAYYNWIRASVQENKPWDRFVRELITASGSNVDNGAASFFVLHKHPIALTETTTQAFLGMSLTCSRCHNHPLEKWTMADYYGMANLYARVALKNGDRPGETLVLAAESGEVNHPRTGTPMPPRPLESRAISLVAAGDRRETLAAWLTSPNNPYFARTVVNRVWRNFLGRGLVEAEDDLRATNPPSNAELLAALERDFAGHGFDLKRLMRLIMESATYQRSAAPGGAGGQDEKYYSHYIVRRLPAEVILDALSHATGVPTEFSGYPKGTRALQLPDSQVASYFLAAFGRPERVQTCSCERQEEPSILQALHLNNGETINQKLRAPGGIVVELLAKELPDEPLLGAVFLRVLGRPATDGERRTMLPVLAAAPASDRTARREVLEDLFWSLLTTKEFLFNH